MGEGGHTDLLLRVEGLCKAGHPDHTVQFGTDRQGRQREIRSVGRIGVPIEAVVAPVLKVPWERDTGRGDMHFALLLEHEALPTVLYFCRGTNYRHGSGW